MKASAQAADLTDRAAIFAMVERIRDEVGVVDIFVHNAGIAAQGWGYTPFLQSPESESEWNAWLQLNLHGLMHACQALLPAMQQKGWGRIVAINSDAARTATGMGLCAYGAAKAAAVGFIRNLSGEVGPHGVTANAVSLGTMNNWEGSQKIARKGTSVGRAGSPQDVGAAVSYLASTEAQWVNGQVLPVNGGGLVARARQPCPAALPDRLAVVKTGRLFCHSRDRELWLRRRQSLRCGHSCSANRLSRSQRQAMCRQGRLRPVFLIVCP